MRSRGVATPRSPDASISVVTADATQVDLEGQFDAALMLSTPDIYDSAKALDNLIPH